MILILVNLCQQDIACTYWNCVGDLVSESISVPCDLPDRRGLTSVHSLLSIILHFLSRTKVVSIQLVL